jgi:hypothetical protein
MGSLAFAGLLFGSVAFAQASGVGKVSIQDLTLVNETDAAGKVDKVEFHHHHGGHHHHHHHHGFHHFDHHHHHHHHHHGFHHHHHGYKSSAADVEKQVPSPKVQLDG